MIQIRRIEPTEWADAKLLVYRVAHAIFNETRSLEDMIAHFDSLGALDDMLDIQKNYFDRNGIFLVMLDGEKMICTGGVRQIDGEVCELKRVWLLTAYHGQGLGYRMMQKLLAFARARGYKRMRLETDPVSQRQAYIFYERLGFREIPFINPQPNEEDIMMEMEL
jgi:putative acetyltransferase